MTRTYGLDTRALDPELAAWAKQAAKARGLTHSTYVARLIRLHQRLTGLAVKGPLARSVLAEYGLQEIQAGLSKGVAK